MAHEHTVVTVLTVCFSWFFLPPLSLKENPPTATWDFHICVTWFLWLNHQMQSAVGAAVVAHIAIVQRLCYPKFANPCFKQYYSVSHKVKPR